MMIQILKEYEKRTEYRVLEKFVTVQQISIDELSEGILLLPGILLGKLENKDIERINQWISNPNNQVMLTPAWKEVNLKDFFDISLDLKVLKGEYLDYKGIECQYKIEGKVQEKLFATEKGDLCIHYRKDTGSGLLTVITLPLLDYKLSHKHEEFRQHFLVCMKKITPKETKQKVKKEVSKIGEDHIQIFMLMAAGFKLEKDLKVRFHTYFNLDIKMERIRELERDLFQQGFIDNEGISDKGKALIIEKKLKSFIKILEGGKRIDEW
ncbi:hypothetical protein [Bacillus wiedmannii]|uniref:hypothetical protein n=1 Tax=Bacillus wiedmannii TaxID=1890302 RepID=UPI000BF336AC|nr:hypothetical protein [Bacillus wiedmannii]PGD70272.1 hypothetical protein COM44_12615 [Bacillus wiedmannii]